MRTVTVEEVEVETVDVGETDTEFDPEVLEVTETDANPVRLLKGEEETDVVGLVESDGDTVTVPEDDIDID